MARWQRHAETALGSRTSRPAPRAERCTCHVSVRRWRLDGDFDTEGGALLDTAIRHAMTRDVDGEPPAPRPAAAPTLSVDLARWYLDHHHDNKVARRRTHLDVIIAVDNLQHGGPGELHDGTIVDPKTMARLACDAHLHRVIMDRSSTILDYGRRTHIVPHGLREASTSAIGTADSRTVIDPPPGVKPTTFSTGNSAAPPDPTTSCCYAAGITTSSTSTAGNTLCTPTTPSKSSPPTAAFPKPATPIAAPG